MTILETSRDFTPTELYALTKNPKTTNLKDHNGELIEVTGYCLYEDVNTKGETRTILSLELTEGEAIATNSATALRSLHDILEIFKAGGNENPYPIPLIIYSDKAKGSGRTFYDLMLDH